MILERIELQNFLSHRDSVLDFTPARLWLISGDNGSGKSAILDALEYALYGKHRGGSWDAALLVRHGATQARILVVFQHGGQRYQIVQHIILSARPVGRGARQNQGNGSTVDERLPAARREGQLARWLDDVGTWQPITLESAAAGSVWKWVARNVVPHEQFRSAMYLRQGDAAHFLTSDQSKRSERFAALLHLDRYTALSQQAKEWANKAQVQRDKLNLELGVLGDLSEACSLILERDLVTAQEACDQAEAGYTAADTLYASASTWTRLVGDRADLEKHLAQAERLLSDAEAIRAAAGHVRAWDAVAQQLAGGWRHQEEAVRKRAKVGRCQADASAKQTQLTANEAELTKLDRELAEQTQAKDNAAAKLERIKQELADLRHEQAIAQAHADEAAAAAAVAAHAGADNTLAAWQRREAALPVIDKWLQATAALTRVQETLRAKEETEAEAQTQCKSAECALIAATEAWQQAMNAQTNWHERIAALDTTFAQLEGRVSAHTGLPQDAERCPTCDQRLDAVAHTHVREVLSDERTALAGLQVARNDAIQKRDEAVQLTATVKQKKEAADEAMRRANTAFTEAHAERVRTEATRDAVSEREEESQLALVRLALSQPLAALDDTWLTDERQAVAAGLPHARQTVDNLNAARVAARDATTHLNLLHRQRRLAALPLGDEQDTEVLATQVQQQEDLRVMLQGQHDTAHERSQLLSAKKVDLEKLCTRLRTEAEGLLRQTTELEDDARQEEESATAVKANLEPQWAMLLDDQVAYEAQAAAIADLRSQADQLHDLAVVRGKQDAWATQLKKVAEEEAHIPVEARLPLTEAEAARKKAAEGRDNAKGDRDHCAKACEEFQANRALAATLRDQINDAEQERATYNELAELLKEDGAIQRAVAEAEQRRVAGAANAILEQINDPLRLEINLARRRGAGQDVTIRDLSEPTAGSDNGGRRYFEFLSGGEQFRIALALALAVHGRIGGAVGTIIVDEGFGALHADRRDALALQLTNPGGGILASNLAHSLIICSHSTEVQRHFPHRWLVEKQAGVATVSAGGTEEGW